MKFTCTQKEKEWLLESMPSAPVCFLQGVDCKAHNGCRECLEKEIVWEIVPESPIPDWKKKGLPPPG